MPSMKSRCDFVKLLGGGASASLFASHILEDSKAAMPKAATTKVTFKPLRLAQTPSYPVYRKKVQAGHWYIHDLELRGYTDLGSVLRLQKIAYVEMRAVFFGDSSQEHYTSKMYTDPKSEDFKQVIRMSKQGRKYAFYGPVYVLTDRDFQYELFCSSKSMRRFAAQEIGLSSKANVILTSKIMSTEKFSWFVPSLCD